MSALRRLRRERIVSRVALAACVTMAIGAATHCLAGPPEGASVQPPIDHATAITSFLDQDALNTPSSFGSARSVAEGKRLFASMNCAGCHGYTGGGGMGPDLTDRYWRYGGRPSDIYRTIFEGRPQGMPGFGKAITSQDIWKLAAYVRSLQAPPGSSTSKSTAQPDPGFDTGGPPATHPTGSKPPAASPASR